MKFCGRCKKYLENSLFERRGISGLQAWCKSCKREYDRSYAKNNEKRKKDLKKSRDVVYERNRSFLISFKNKPCLDCGKKYPPQVMDFHHMKKKKYNVSKLVSYSMSKLVEELNKCVLLCSNCHRMRTFENRIV